MPRSVVRTFSRTFVGTLALLVGSASASAGARDSWNTFRCTSPSGLSIEVPTGMNRFMQDIVISGSPGILGNLVDRKKPDTYEEVLRLTYNFTPTCASTLGESIECDGRALASASYSYSDEAAEETVTVAKQLRVRDSMFELIKDENGVYHLYTQVITQLAESERTLEIKETLGPIVNSPNPWNPGCESVPNPTRHQD